MRQAYLARFADREGRVFLDRFTPGLRGEGRAAILQSLVRGRRLTPGQIAWVYRAAVPVASGAPSWKELQDVYGWLFRTTRRDAQDRRIRTLLEVKAFAAIHTEWKRHGYPFETLMAEEKGGNRSWRPR